MFNKISKKHEGTLINDVERNEVNSIILSLNEIRSTLSQEIQKNSGIEKDISVINGKLDLIIERIANIESMMRDNIIHIGL